MKKSSEAQDWLRQFCISVTWQRILIVDYLLRHPHSHSSADTIYQGLIREGNTLSRATVYNNLRTLSECGALAELETGLFGRHYDIDQNDHAHKICRKCGKIEDLALPLSPQDMRKAAGEDFQIGSIQLTYYGVCSSCQDQSAKRESI